MLTKKDRLLVIAPHFDDEVLGCGGLIKKIKQVGGKVYVQFVTVGKTQDFSKKGYSEADERIEEMEEVAKFLKFDAYNIAYNGESHLQLDLVGHKKLIDLIERNSPVAIERVRPTIVAFPSIYSYNQDHQMVARAVHAALRPAESTKFFVNTALAYEVPADYWSVSEQHVPNFFLKLTVQELAIKKTAIKLYSSQLRPPPNPRSIKTIEALARLRGSLCGARYAEGFLMYRSIV